MARFEERKFPRWCVKVWEDLGDENNPFDNTFYYFDTEEEAKAFFDGCKCNSRFRQIDLFIEYEDYDEKLWCKESYADGPYVYRC